MKAALALQLFSVLVAALPADTAVAATNEVAAGNAKRAWVSCGPVAVIYCKGTFEPTEYGIVVGNQFTTALQAVLPFNTQFSGVGYLNGVVGYLTGGSLQGIWEMQDLAESYVSSCPNIKLVMAGYSQGAQVTHRAIEGLSQSVRDHIKAVVFFGDPMSGRAVPGIDSKRVYTNCALGDGICTGLPLVTLSHFAYAVDFVGAADFVRNALNDNLSSGLFDWFKE